MVNLGIHIGLRDAFNLLHEIVTLLGRDHVATNPNGDTGCTYGALNPKTGVLEPVCIVGHVAARWGVLGLIQMEGICNPDGPVFQYLEDVGIVVEGDAQEFFADAQKWQDGRVDSNEDREWGLALDYAVSQAVERAEAASTAHQLRNLSKAYADAAKQKETRERFEAYRAEGGELARWEWELVND